MSGKLMHLVWEAELPHSEKWVLMAMADFANDDGELFCSLDYLAWKSGLGERQVRRILGQLVDRGTLVKTGWHRTEAGSRVRSWRVVHTALPWRVPYRDEPDIMSSQVGDANRTTAGSEPDIPAERSGHDGVLPERQSRTSEQNVSEPGPAAFVPFDAFWEVYPRRVGKLDARVRFDRAVKGGTPADVIIAGAVRYRDDPNREPEFTAHPSTWLNQGRWDDDPLPERNGHRKVADPLWT